MTERQFIAVYKSLYIVFRTLNATIKVSVDKFLWSKRNKAYRMFCYGKIITRKPVAERSCCDLVTKLIILICLDVCDKRNPFSILTSLPKLCAYLQNAIQAFHKSSSLNDTNYTLTPSIFSRIQP